MAEAKETISVHVQDEVLVLAIELATITQYEESQTLGKELLDAANEHSADKIVVDLSKVEFMSSVGYLPLVGLRSSIRKRDGHVVLANLSPEIKEMFVATRMLINPRSPGSPFHYAESVGDAIALLRESEDHES